MTIEDQFRENNCYKCSLRNTNPIYRNWCKRDYKECYKEYLESKLQESEKRIEELERIVKDFENAMDKALENLETCPECGGNGGDYDDSSKDCYLCEGTGKITKVL